MSWTLVGNIKGPKGDDATPSEVFTQSTPLATWVFTHSMGRIPVVAIYLGTELVLAPVNSTSTQVSVTFPSPQTGYLILS